MNELQLYSVGDIAKRLNATASTLTYLILKHRIDHDGLIAGRVRVYAETKLALISELIGKKRRRRRNCIDNK